MGLAALILLPWFGTSPGAPEAQIVTADHPVEDVTFENRRIHGKLVTRPEEGKIRINPHVRNARFLPAAGRD